MRVIQCMVRNSTTIRLHNCRSNCDDDDDDDDEELGVVLLLLVLLLLDVDVEYAVDVEDIGAMPVVIMRDEWGDIRGDDVDDGSRWFVVGGGGGTL